MRAGTALTAWMMQKSAPFTVRYGSGLDFVTAELPTPRKVVVPTREGRVTCWVQDPPATVGPVVPPPVVVHLHGGAFIMRYPKMDDFYTRVLAAEVGAAVVSVDYDVAPQRAYPVAQHEAHDVAAWFADHGAGLGLDGSRVALSGFSAGGNLAASAALQARDSGSFRPSYVVLGVPSLDLAEPAADKRATVVNPMIDARLLELVRSAYFPDVDRRCEPYASPVLAPSLAGLPPTLVLTAELDALRSEGDVFAARLADEGVEVTHRVIRGRDHYFMLGSDRDQARQTLDLVVGRLQRAFRASPQQGQARMTA